jgi:hypothetical protein
MGGLGTMTDIMVRFEIGDDAVHHLEVFECMAGD